MTREELEKSERGSREREREREREKEEKERRERRIFLTMPTVQTNLFRQREKKVSFGQGS